MMLPFVIDPKRTHPSSFGRHLRLSCALPRDLRHGGRRCRYNQPHNGIDFGCSCFVSRETYSAGKPVTAWKTGISQEIRPRSPVGGRVSVMFQIWEFHSHFGNVFPVWEHWAPVRPGFYGIDRRLRKNSPEFNERHN
jgi:hypothetical protein